MIKNRNKNNHNTSDDENKKDCVITEGERERLIVGSHLRITYEALPDDVEIET